MFCFQDHNFFRLLKFPAFFPTCLARRKERQLSKPGKNRGLENCSNIFFPLGHYALELIMQEALDCLEFKFNIFYCSRLAIVLMSIIIGWPNSNGLVSTEASLSLALTWR